jgi:type IV pilus assembly protein PilA
VLVVIGILAILLAISLVAINPNRHFQDARNSQRASNVNAVLDAIYEYESANNGNAPSNLSSLVADTPTSIALAVSMTGKVDLCNLTPTHIADLPTDPTSGSSTGGSTPCNASTTAYDTGYTVTKTSGGRYTVSAPSSEGGATISVTR